MYLVFRVWRICAKYTLGEQSILYNDQPKQSASHVLVVMNHPILSSQAWSTRQHQITLEDLKQFRGLFRFPSLIALQCLKMFRDPLLHITLTWIVSKVSGNFRCNANRCKTCPILRTTDMFASKTTDKQCTIKYMPPAKCKMKPTTCI